MVTRTEVPSVPRRAHRPVRTPTVLQMEAVECGAASLAMIMGYYGRFVPLEQLRAECGVSRDGSKATNIVLAARHYGLHAVGRRWEIEDLAALDRPVILWWGFNHFVVFEGFGRRKARINDPASGRRTIPMDEFDTSFTGIVIDCEPTTSFERRGRPFSAVRAVVARLQPQTAAMIQATLAGLFASIPGVVSAAFLTLFVDDVLGRGERSLLVPLLGGVALASVLRFATTRLQQRQLLRLQVALADESADSYLWRVMRAPMEFYGQRFTADLSRRMDSSSQLAQTIAGLLAGMFLSAFTALVYAVAMVVLSWQLAIVVVALTAVNVWAMSVVIRRRRSLSQVLAKYQSDVATTTYGGLRTIETLKATSSEQFYFAKWAGAQANLEDSENSLAAPGIVLGAVPVLVDALVAASLIVIGGLQVLNGTLSLGELVAFQSLALLSTAPVRDIMNTSSIIQAVGVQIERVDDVLNQDPDQRFEDRPDATTAEPTGAIELRDVTFGYSRLEDPLIEDLNLTVQPGRSVALVGPSGAGKSTVVRLVTGLLHPWSGSVLFDGVPTSELAIGAMTRAMAVVEQSVALFEGTIRENLTLWDTSISDDSVERAAEDAQIAETILDRPGGFDAPVGEGGRNWSGGERQRLEIARALAREPKLLVLDEATSALDSATEVGVTAAIAQRPCAVIVVAHRLSTIRDCDEIVVLDDGKVVERGTHNDLMASGGEYAALVGSGGDVGE